MPKKSRCRCSWETSGIRHQSYELNDMKVPMINQSISPPKKHPEPDSNRIASGTKIVIVSLAVRRIIPSKLADLLIRWLGLKHA